MAYAPVKRLITDYVVGAVLQNPAWAFNFFGNNVDYTPGAAVGKVSVPLLTAVSLATPDGTTNLSDGLTNSLVDLTVAERASCMHVNAKNKLAFEQGNLAFMQGFLDLTVDGVLALLDDLINDGIYAATPDTSETITTGYANFGVVTTSADTILASCFLINKHIGNAVAGVAANNGGKMTGIIMKAGKTAWKNLMGIANSGSNQAKVTSNLFYDNALQVLSWNGVPIYRSSATEENNWGVASKECLYVIHQRSYAAVVDRVYLFGDGIIHDGTGVAKLIPIVVFAYGSLNDDLQGMCVNGTS